MCSADAPLALADGRRRPVTFGDAIASGRDNNNLNLIRMLAAAGVLVSHAYPIGLGPSATEPLEPLLGLSLGTISVSVFFAISGFLIPRSLDRTPSIGRFLAARALRLFPALAAVLLATVLLGALATTAPAGSYAAAVPDYLIRNLTLFSLRFDLPGLFEGNPYGPAINGSLWTLGHEVLCYAGVLAAGLAGALANRRRAALGLLGFVAAYALIRLTEPHPRLTDLAGLALPFACGTALYIWRDRVPLSPAAGLALMALALAAQATPFWREALMAALTYVVVLVAFLPGGAVRTYNRLGDYSYGTYLCAFPLQQTLAAAGITDPVTNILLALPATLACAVLSWTFVERPALALLGPKS